MVKLLVHLLGEQAVVTVYIGMVLVVIQQELDAIQITESDVNSQRTFDGCWTASYA